MKSGAQRKFIAFLLLQVLAGTAIGGVNQWTSSGPEGGLIMDVVYHPTNASIVYAASSLAVHKSIDGGATWVTLKEDFGSYNISDLALDPSNSDRLYVAALDGGVFRSSDAGATFARISPIPTDANIDGPNGIVISEDGTILYYSTISGRFFRSINSGQTWSERTSTNSYTRNLILKPGDPMTVYAQGYKFHRSTNGGDTWIESSPSNTTLFGMAIMPGPTTSLWVTAGNSVYTSTTEGASWTLSFGPFSGSLGPIVADPSSPNTLLAAPVFRPGALYRYSNGTWWPTSGTQLPASSALAISPSDSSIVLAATNEGILRTANIGGSWSKSHTGIYAGDIRHFTTSGARTYAGTPTISLAYTVHGNLWQGVSTAGIIPQPNPYLESIAVHPTNPDKVFVGIQMNGAWRSEDSGNTWASIPSIPMASHVNSVAFDPSNSNTMYATVTPQPFNPVGTGVYRSTDGGLSFAPVSNGLTYPFPNTLHVDPQTPSRIYLAGGIIDGARGVLRSTNNGADWTNVLGDIGTFDFAIDPNDSQRMYVATGGLQTTANGGGNWSNVSVAPAQGSVYLLAIDPVRSSTLYVVSASYASTAETFVMRSVNRGQTWERIANKALPNWAVTKLNLNANRPNTVFLAVAGRGVQSLEIVPDLSVSITGHSEFKGIGVNSTFETRIQNTGPYAASDVNVAVEIPATAQNVDVSVDRGSCSVAAGSVNCIVPYIQADESIAARIAYTPTISGALTVRATATAREHDLTPANNEATATATVAELVDLFVTGTAAPATVNTGNAFTYTFNVTNAGPSVSTVNQLTIQLPTGLTVTNIAPSATCMAINLTVDCNLGSLNPTAGASITISATSNASGVMRATATAVISPNAVEVNAGNNTVESVVTVNDPPTTGGGNGGGSNVSGGGGGGGGSWGWQWLLALCALYTVSRSRAAVPNLYCVGWIDGRMARQC